MGGGHSAMAAYAALLLLMGLVKSWTQPALNNPVFAEIVSLY